MSRFKNTADYIGYMFKRNNWALDPRRLRSYEKSVAIDRPVFLVGNQGGGLTLVSRMLRRHIDVVSITGNSNYWAGADEMQKVMMTRLPLSLRLGGRVLAKDFPHPVFIPPRSWSYGADDLVSKYYRDEADYSLADSKVLRRMISEALAIHGGRQGTERFVDKSQVYTLKTRYIQALLSDCSPHFVLVTRDPYVACHRAASGKAGDMNRYKDKLSYRERVKICAEHWSNTIGKVLSDSEHLNKFLSIQFEEILEHPEESVRQLCEFLELTFDEKLIPQADDVIPFGSRRIDRWYPLRPGVNLPYFDRLDEETIEIIDKRCGALAAQLGYSKPIAKILISDQS